MTAASDGLADKFDLAGGNRRSWRRRGDFALERLEPGARGRFVDRLSPLTSAHSWMACGTSLQAALPTPGRKNACGQIVRRFAAGSDTTSDAPIVFGPAIHEAAVKAGQRQIDGRIWLAALKGNPRRTGTGSAGLRRTTHQNGHGRVLRADSPGMGTSATASTRIDWLTAIQKLLPPTIRAFPVT